MHKYLPIQQHAVSLHELYLLEGVARRLSATYPPDWLERHARPVYWTAVAASFLAAVLCGASWGPWWGFAVALLGPTCLLVILPRLLFGRTAGRPRWAHRLAALDGRDEALVRGLALGPHCETAISGEQFFAIWRHAHCLVEQRCD